MATKREKEMDAELQAKIMRAIQDADQLEGIDSGTRVGSTSHAEVVLVKLLVEEMFTKVSPKLRAEVLGSLNEILCFIGAADKKLNPAAHPGKTGLQGLIDETNAKGGG